MYRLLISAFLSIVLCTSVAVAKSNDYTRAKDHYKYKYYDRAIEELNAYIQEAPNDMRARELLVRCYLESFPPKMSAAKEAADQAAAVNEKEARRMASMFEDAGHAALKHKRVINIGTAYREAISLDPRLQDRLVTDMYKKAVSYIGEDDSSRALILFPIVHSITPKYDKQIADVCYKKAVAMTQKAGFFVDNTMGVIDQEAGPIASQLLQQAAELSSAYAPHAITEPRALFLLAATSRTMGHLDAASKLYARIAALNPPANQTAAAAALSKSIEMQVASQRTVTKEQRNTFMASAASRVHSHQGDPFDLIRHDGAWVEKRISLSKDRDNTVTIGGAPGAIAYLRSEQRGYTVSHLCGASAENERRDLAPGDGITHVLGGSQDQPFCTQFRFDPMPNDAQLSLFLPTKYQSEYSIETAEEELAAR